MSNKQFEQVHLPVGRMVKGNLYSPRTTDKDGKPLVIKNGPKAGQPRVDYFLAVAIPKAGEQHWSNTEWGTKIYQFGARVMPNAYQRQDFAWKITDGDSQQANKENKRPCDQEGFPGHWVLFLGSGNAPRICNRDGSQMLTEPGVVKCGHYVEVLLTVTDNGSQGNPGIFLNHTAIAHAGFGPEISVGVDVAAVGFGKGPAPAGMTTMPAAALPGAPVVMPPVAAVAPPVVTAPPVPGAAVPPPHPAILNVPQMTAKAAGATYEQFKANGWTDETMRANGYMV